MPESTTEKVQHDTIESPYRISWRRLLKIILPIFVLFFAIAYWFVGIYTPSKIEAPTTVPIPDFQESTLSAKPATPSAQVEGTEDWKSYTNSKLGISLKHPNEFSTILERSDSLEETITSVVFGSNKDFSLADPDVTVFEVAKGKFKTAYEKISSLEINKTSTDETAGTSVTFENTRLENVTVDNTIGIKKMSIVRSKEVIYHLFVYVKKGPSYYGISLRSGTKENFEKYTKTFDLIISTFKFLN